MDKGFDFESVGKRMPYNVPDGFFDCFEKNMLERIESGQADAVADGSCRMKKGKTDKARVVALFSLVASAAAVVLLLLAVWNYTPGQNAATDYLANMETAYNNLTDEEQDFLLSIYEDDLFYNDEI